MKKIAFCIILIILINNTGFSQSCFPYGINFKTQELLDNFLILYPDCTEIGGTVIISDQGTNDITNLNGLINITSIGGYLFIGDNQILTSLSGLDNLSSIGNGLEITDNSGLSDISSLNNLTSINDDLVISNNDSITDLQGLNNITFIGGKLNIFSCDRLLSVSDLGNLSFVGGSLWIHMNPNLSNLDGLENITSVGDTLGISFNQRVNNLNGIIGISSIGGELNIWNNDSLSSIEGLQNVTSVNGRIRITQNHSLVSLTGLDNISPNTIQYLQIYSNAVLSACEVESVCEYLTLPNSNTIIGGNSIGCNSVQEILNKCSVNIQKNYEKSITIYPNPTEENITISNDSNLPIDYIKFYNHQGQLVKSVSYEFNNINISQLKQGIYIIILYSGDHRTQKKIIVK